MLKHMVILILCATPAIAWWDNDWTERVQINMSTTWQNGAENMSNFPILVTINSSVINYSAMNTNGTDIRFIDGNDVDILSYEIDYWNASGNSQIWVKIPQLDGNVNNDSIYLYYENPSATNGENISDVWSNGYNLVMHFNQNLSSAAPQVIDSTSGNFDGNASSGLTNENDVAAFVGRGVYFNGTTNQNISLGTSDGLNANGASLAMEVVFRYPTGTIAASHTHFGGTTAFLRQQTAATTGRFGTSNGTGNNLDASSIFAAGNWYHFAGFTNGTNKNLYRNGVRVATVAMTGTNADRAGDFLIGLGTAGTLPMNGTIDEVRMSNVTRTHNWINGTYRTIFVPFNTFGTIQTGGGGDSCTYVSGDHTYALEDNCIISSTVNAAGNTITVSGASGSLTIASGGELICKRLHYTPTNFNGDSTFAILTGGKKTVQT